MNSAIKREILEQVNKRYDTFKIMIMTDDVFELPKHIYEKPSVLLDAGDGLGLPANMVFYPKKFCILASFNKVLHDLKIPYKNLLGIWDFDMDKGIYFMSGPPVVLVPKTEPVPEPGSLN
jgi:hypothetical protein